MRLFHVDGKINYWISENWSLECAGMNGFGFRFFWYLVTTGRSVAREYEIARFLSCDVLHWYQFECDNIKNDHFVTQVNDSLSANIEMYYISLVNTLGIDLFRILILKDNISRFSFSNLGISFWNYFDSDFHLSFSFFCFSNKKNRPRYKFLQSCSFRDDSQKYFNFIWNFE